VLFSCHASRRCEEFYFTNVKVDLIHKFEINLSGYMLQRGFAVHAMFPYVSSPPQPLFSTVSQRSSPAPPTSHVE
jgi:hypothetical protein